jgi:HlyD family secretion protein
VTQASNTLTADKKQRDYTCRQKPDSVTGLPTKSTINSQCDAAKAKVTFDSTQVTIAQNNLAKLQAPAKAADVTAAQKAVDSAQAQVNSAQAKLDQVRAGAKPDDLTIAEAALTQAQAALALKQKPYTDADLQSAQAAVDQAQAALDLALYNLSNAVLTAPFAGVVSAVNVASGELSSAASPAIVLVNPTDIRLDVNVDETDVANVAPGQKARVAFDALPGKQFDGVVYAVAPNATIQSGVSTYAVSINIANAEGIRPGMSGNAGIVYAEKADALLVPNRSIHREGRDRYVDVLVGDKSEKRPVKIGLTNDQDTEIVEGLAEGDAVVIPTTTSFQFTPPSRATATPRSGQ